MKVIDGEGGTETLKQVFVVTETALQRDRGTNGCLIVMITAMKMVVMTMTIMLMKTKMIVLMMTMVVMMG